MGQHLGAHEHPDKCAALVTGSILHPHVSEAKPSHLHVCKAYNLHAAPRTTLYYMTMPAPSDCNFQSSEHLSWHLPAIGLYCSDLSWSCCARPTCPNPEGPAGSNLSNILSCLSQLTMLCLLRLCPELPQIPALPGLLLFRPPPSQGVGQVAFTLGHHAVPPYKYIQTLYRHPHFPFILCFTQHLSDTSVCCHPSAELILCTVLAVIFVQSRFCHTYRHCTFRPSCVFHSTSFCQSAATLRCTEDLHSAGCDFRFK